MEEEHGNLTFYYGCMFSLPRFQFESVNIFTILTSKLKCVCTFRDLFLGYHLEYIYLEWNLVKNKQIRLNCVLFLHPDIGGSCYKCSVHNVFYKTKVKASACLPNTFRHSQTAVLIKNSPKQNRSSAPGSTMCSLYRRDIQYSSVSIRM